jgi:uncharacterized membrane protein
MQWKAASLILMALMYVVAGLLHFIKPKMYLRIMPPYLPAHLLLVYLSGFAEVGLGVGLLIPSLQVYAAWGVILLLIAVFPANIYMYQKGGAAFKLSDRVVFWRMPFQLVLIVWAYWYTR